jgi:hypothetical protein
MAKMPEQLWLNPALVALRPSVKTEMVMQTLREVLKAGPVVHINLEMTEAQVARKVAFMIGSYVVVPAK